MPRRILAGVRVVDITHLVAGPVAVRALADLGASVVKVERMPGTRARIGGSDYQDTGKRSIAVDLHTAEGAKIARRLALGADVLVENLRPGALDDLGLGFEALAADNPRLIYGSVSGFGRDNERRAFGATAHAEAGFLWVQQQAQGGEEPFAPGIQVADVLTGMNLFAGLLAALYDREDTGRGQHVDVALMDSQLAMLSELAANYLNGPPGTPWRPFRHPIHRSRDGWHFTLNGGWPHNWARIARALGHPERAEALPPDADALARAWIAAMDGAGVARALEAEGAPYGHVKDIDEALAHPHFEARGMLADVEGADGRPARLIRSPLFFSDADASPAGRVPRPGEHTREVMRELGYAEEEIERCIGAGIVSEG